MYKTLSFALVLLFLISSCSIDPCLTKGLFVQEYDKMTENVFENYEDYSEKEWESKDARMETFIDQCYKEHGEKMSDNEKKSFWIKYFKYKYYRHGKSLMRAIESDAKEYSISIDEEMDEIFDDPEEDVKIILNELYGDDIDESIDKFVKGIEDIAEKLKEWLKED